MTDTDVQALSGDELRVAVGVELFDFTRASFAEYPESYWLRPPGFAQRDDYIPARADAQLQAGGMFWVPDFTSDQIIEQMRKSGHDFVANETHQRDWPHQVEPILYRVGFFSWDNPTCGFGVTFKDAVSRAALIAKRARPSSDDLLADVIAEREARAAVAAQRAEREG